MKERKKKLVLITFVAPMRSFRCNLATAYLKSYALTRPEIAEGCIIDLIAEFTEANNDYIVEKLLKREYDLLGFSCYTWNMDKVSQVTKAIKRRNADLPIVCGGPEVSFNPQECLGRERDVDILVVGEGEVPFVHLIESILFGTRSLESIAGICYRKNGQCCFNPQNMSVNINMIPSPFTTGVIDLETVRGVLYETYRGCVQNCYYCVWGKNKKVRFFDLKRVKNDLTALLNVRSLSSIWFIDSAANFPPSRFIKILKHIGSINNPRVEINCELDIRILDSEMIAALQLIPRGYMLLGLQSGNEKTLARANRKTSMESVVEKLKLLQQAKLRNIDIWIDLIFGLPGDTMDDIHSAIDLVLSHGFAVNSHVLCVLPGTRFRTDAQEFGLQYNPLPPYEISSTRELSEDEIRVLKRYVNILDIMKVKMVRIIMIQCSFHTGTKVFDLLKLFAEKFGIEGLALYKSKQKFKVMLEDFVEEILTARGDQEGLAFFKHLIAFVASKIQDTYAFDEKNGKEEAVCDLTYDFSHFDIDTVVDTVHPGKIGTLLTRLNNLPKAIFDAVYE